MRAFISAICLCTVGLVACGGSDDKSPSSNDNTNKQSTAQQTVDLASNQDGTLNYCDSSGTCSSLPNPDNCANLTVTIDATGATCQVCTASNGTVGEQNCSSPLVVCETVSIANPPCLVCAYTNGTIIYSNCEPQMPICYTANADGSTSLSGGGSSGQETVLPATDAAGAAIAPLPIGCSICLDASGYVISRDCPPSCTNQLCPVVDCAIGYQPVTKPGDCCTSCEPVPACNPEVACNDMIPVCPDGQALQHDPTTCCGYFCALVNCDPSEICPPMGIDCESGYIVSRAAPHCCGACVPIACKGDSDCPEDTACLFAITSCQCETGVPCNCPPSPTTGQCTPTNN